MSSGPDSEVVRLDVPASTEHLRLVRLVVVGLATSHGADIDDLEDLRIATGELCTALVEAAGDDDRLLVEAAAGGAAQGTGAVLALTLTVPGVTGPEEFDELAAMVLETTTDRFGLGPAERSGGNAPIEGTAARAWYERRFRAGGEIDAGSTDSERGGDG